MTQSDAQLTVDRLLHLETCLVGGENDDVNRFDKKSISIINSMDLNCSHIGAT